MNALDSAVPNYLSLIENDKKIESWEAAAVAADCTVEELQAANGHAASSYMGAFHPSITHLRIPIATSPQHHLEAFSDTEGVYRLSALPVGQFDITVELPGFASVDRKGTTVNVGQTLTIDFAM